MPAANVTALTALHLIANPGACRCFRSTAPHPPKVLVKVPVTRVTLLRQGDSPDRLSTNNSYNEQTAHRLRVVHRSNGGGPCRVLRAAGHSGEGMCGRGSSKGTGSGRPARSCRHRQVKAITLHNTLNSCAQTQTLELCWENTHHSVNSLGHPLCMCFAAMDICTRSLHRPY